MTRGFVMMSCVNVTVMLDQVLEEVIGEDSIARKPFYNGKVWTE